MIKGVIKAKDGRKLTVIGLSEGNIERLRRHDDILIDLGTIGIPGIDLMICAGPVEEDIVAYLHNKYKFDVDHRTNTGGDITAAPDAP